eukprot:Gregarina_sp_Poly_1__206@NODE_1048_length_5238_cov_33_236125_g728_i0_p2_GENE_NODE_1048_length_5238_cov_33_236125_g728_i0NODE_1048_length_5238_cov_33_236125_g728_i0_p2_ORF_typecomplete_len252_score37_36_NODE_1048_length_5238_cov_33_236125_g728_i0223978
MSSHEESSSSKTHSALMADFVDAFYEVCRRDQLWPHGAPEEQREGRTFAEAASDALKQQWNRSVFLEDPTNRIGHLDELIEEGSTVNNESDKAIQTALKTFQAIQSQYQLKSASLTHLKPISFISGKLAHLIDLRVLVVDRIPSEQYLPYSKSVADWTFFILADESGSVVGAFHPELPKAVARKVSYLEGGSRNAKKLPDLIQVGDVCAFFAIKTISLFGTTMVTFSTKSNVAVLGTYMCNYAVDFGQRQG